MGCYDLARPQASHLCHDLALAFLCRAVRHPVRSAAGGDGRGLSVQAAGRTMGGTRFPELADRARHRAAGTTGCGAGGLSRRTIRSEEHTSELQSLMRISYAVFCLKKKTQYRIDNN